MPNHLNIQSVRVTFLHPSHPEHKDLYGWWVYDDYENREVLDFPNAEAIPGDLESVLNYLHDEEPLAYELVSKHVNDGKGLNLDGKHVTADVLAEIIQRYQDPDEETTSLPETE